MNSVGKENFSPSLARDLSPENVRALRSATPLKNR